ncbi:auxin-activated signaling pathway [Teratosphaeria destructans]|uniref:Auxin-activated signaling pathway n=1 Tax=Teratosphaeria destructans TaxID=418781 RepID=A0A9W7VYE8_9PEZI|nr:auxin-activated signaling pathway [Teratosphaeria destructans]
MPSPAVSPAQQQPQQQQHHGGSSRPPLMKRHSSSTGQSSQHGGASRLIIASPGSASVGDDRPLRQAHAVGGGRRGHARIQLSRNHSSGRNLNKLGQRAPHPHPHPHPGGHYGDNGRRHSRQRSHEGDTEIRLPGSLDESRPAIRRNLTAYELPRNVSRTKLKKNLSHGQLTRLNPSSKNLAGMTGASHRAPLSPGLKGKSKRPKSADMEKDSHEQEVAPPPPPQQQHQQRRSSQQQKKVGFAVGSAGDNSDAEAVPDMEGSGLQEDEWTDQSNSASPYSTRQNTANNSRRTSVISPDMPLAHPPPSATQQSQITEARPLPRPVSHTPQVPPDPEITPTQSEDADDDTEEDEESPNTMAKRAEAYAQKQRQHRRASNPPTQAPLQEQQPVSAKVRDSLPAKEHPNPVAKRLTSNQLPAPALISSVSTFDDKHNSTRGPSDTPIGASQAHLAGTDGAADDGDELVSRFMPSTSHPQNSTGSCASTAFNTPKQGSYQTPEEDSALHRARSAPFQVPSGPGPVSPVSTISGSSGAATPALGRSRIELKMMHDKALADREEAAERRPLVPHHIYDRRNETLKSYLNLAHMGGGYQTPRVPGHATPTIANLSLGPEIFQGRFKAVNTELRVVQKFRDPIAEAVARLQKCRGTKLAGGPQRSAGAGQKQAAALKPSKSAVSLPAPAARSGSSREPSKLSTSTSPPKNPIVGSMAKSDSPSKSTIAGRRQGEEQRRHPKRGVSFAGAPPSSRPQTRDEERDEDAPDPDRIARMMWESLGV